jgi:4-diphosphocytidyl-2-C-methyl-D-erythritol kinase
VPTPWAYSRWKDAVEVPGVSYEAQQFAWGTLVNDLERPVFEKYLFLAMMKRWLLEQPEVAGALMSGSGSTMLAVLETAEAAEAVGARVAEQFGTDLWCRLCQTISSAR